MNNIKNFFHCLRCTSFRKCERKFDPSPEDIFTSSLLKEEEGIIIFADPIRCERPILKALE